MKCKDCKLGIKANEEWMLPDEEWYYCKKHSPHIGYVLDGEMECESQQE